MRSAGSAEFASLSARAPVSDAADVVCPGAWTLDGNAGTLPGTGLGQNYLGTADNTPLVIAVNGTQAAQLSPSSNFSYPDSSNIVLGSSGNFAGAGIGGATVSGGGSAQSSCGPGGNQPCANSATGLFSTIGGGEGNGASGINATIAGGYTNRADGGGAFVGGSTFDTATGGGSVVSRRRHQLCVRACCLRWAGEPTTPPAVTLPRWPAAKPIPQAASTPSSAVDRTIRPAALPPLSAAAIPMCRAAFSNRRFAEARTIRRAEPVPRCPADSRISPAAMRDLRGRLRSADAQCRAGRQWGHLFKPVGDLRRLRQFRYESGRFDAAVRFNGRTTVSGAVRLAASA